MAMYAILFCGDSKSQWSNTIHHMSG